MTIFDIFLDNRTQDCTFHPRGSWFKALGRIIFGLQESLEGLEGTDEAQGSKRYRSNPCKADISMLIANKDSDHKHVPECLSLL